MLNKEQIFKLGFTQPYDDAELYKKNDHVLIYKNSNTFMLSVFKYGKLLPTYICDIKTEQEILDVIGNE